MDTRIWLSSSIYPTSDWNMDGLVMGRNGGLDVMFASGEPNAHSYTYGSVRPALN